MNIILFNNYKIFCIFIVLWLFYKFIKNKKTNFKGIKNLIIIWIVIIFLNLVINYFNLIYSWRNDSVFKYFLPPYSDYIFVNIKRDLIYYYLTIFISLIISSVFFLVAKRSQQKVLDYYDVGLLFLGGLIVGWSNIIVYLASIFVLTIIGYLGLLIFRKIKPSERIKITPFIILAIIFTLVIGYKISAVLKLY